MLKISQGYYFKITYEDHVHYTYNFHASNIRNAITNELIPNPVDVELEEKGLWNGVLGAINIIRERENIPDNALPAFSLDAPLTIEYCYDEVVGGRRPVMHDREGVGLYVSDTVYQACIEDISDDDSALDEFDDDIQYMKQICPDKEFNIWHYVLFCNFKDLLASLNTIETSEDGGSPRLSVTKTWQEWMDLQSQIALIAPILPFNRFESFIECVENINEKPDIEEVTLCI